MENAILDYVEPLYRFCLKRLSSRQDAEDLTQEILICILEGMKHQKITNYKSYVWQVAHNRYAKKIGQQHRENVVLCGDDYIFDIQDNTPFEDGILSNDEHQTVFSALHTLNAMYRDILVDYYVHELDTSKIALKQGVTNETVKWRLHTGREKMKERFTKMNKTYEKVKIHIMCNGSFGPNQYLCNQIYKVIAMVCYESSVTIEEISMSTGIPTLYLEEALEFMIFGDAIEKIGNKYQTNFIIVHDMDNKRMQKNLQPAVNAIAQKTWESIEKKIADIINIGFYGSQFDVSKLSYILIPELVRGASNKVKQSNPELTPYTRPIRKDGGNGWFIVTEGIDSIDENYSGCNGYSYLDQNGKEKARSSYYWLSDSFDENLSALLKEFGKYTDKINLFTGEFICDNNNEEETAKLISYNLIEKHGNKYFCTIPMLSQEQYDKLLSVLNPCYDEIAVLLKDWMFSLLKEYRSFTPKRLIDQIIGNIDGYSFNAVAFVIKELQKLGKIPSPQPKEIFTANLIYVKK